MRKPKLKQGLNLPLGPYHMKGKTNPGYNRLLKRAVRRMVAKEGDEPLV
jgi:hypothetical protein